MDMTRVTILEENINSNFWSKLVFAMMYIKNNQFTRILKNFSPQKAFTLKLPNVYHFQIFDSTTYVFLQKEKRILKSEKLVPKALKDVLVDYNSYTIYKIYFKNQRKIIYIKDFCIFEGYRSKFFIQLSEYNIDTPLLKISFLQIMIMNYVKMICI